MQSVPGFRESCKGCRYRTLREAKGRYLGMDGPQSTGPEGRTNDATAPSRLDRPRSRRAHVQLNCPCRPTSSANKSARDKNSQPTPRKPRPQNAGGVQGGVVDIVLDARTTTRTCRLRGVEPIPSERGVKRGGGNDALRTTALTCAIPGITVSRPSSGLLGSVDRGIDSSQSACSPARAAGVGIEDRV